MNGRELQASAASALARHRWANTPDCTAATEPGRRAGIVRFEAVVDQDGSLPLGERAQRARRAYSADILDLDEIEDAP